MTHYYVKGLEHTCVGITKASVPVNIITTYRLLFMNTTTFIDKLLVLVKPMNTFTLGYINFNILESSINKVVNVMK